MTKANYIKAGVAALALAASPLTSNAQITNITQEKSESIQRGLQAPIATPKQDTKTHIMYEMPLSKDLQYAIKHSNNPTVYTTSNNSYVKFNKDTTRLILGVHKNDLEKKIGVGIRDKSAISPCDENGLGRIENSLPFAYIKISEQEANKNAQPRDTITQQTLNQNIILEDNSKTNINFYEAKRELDKKAGLHLSLEGKKNLEGNLGQAGAAIQYGGNGIRAGIYGEFGFGKEKQNKITDKENFSSPVDKFGFSSESFGEWTQNQMSKVNYETGVKISMGPADRGLSANINIGLQNYTQKTGEEIYKGVDRTLRYGEVNNEQESCKERGEATEINDNSLIVGASLQKNFKNTKIGVNLGGNYVMDGPFKGFQAKAGVSYNINFRGKKHSSKTKSKGRTNRR